LELNLIKASKHEILLLLGGKDGPSEDRKKTVWPSMAAAHGFDWAATTGTKTG